MEMEAAMVVCGNEGEVYENGIFCSARVDLGEGEGRRGTGEGEGGISYRGETY